MRKYFKQVVLSGILILMLTNAVSLSVNLEEGWNQISAEENFRASDLDSECNLEEVGGYIAWGYENGSWKNPSVLSSETGYFVKAESSCEANVQSLNSTSSKKSLSLGEGWNIISSFSKGRWRCKSSELSGGKAWTFQEGTWSSLQDLGNMRSSKGYWVNLEEGCGTEVGQDLKENTKEIFLEAETDTNLNYGFSVNGTVSAVTTGEDAGGDWDQIVEKKEVEIVDGVTGGGKNGDTWSFNGSITCFKVVSGVARIRVDGEEVETDEYRSYCGSLQDYYGNESSRGGSEVTDIPPVTDPEFESELRKVVGAKRGKNWQQFCDPDGRQVYDVTEAFGAEPDDGSDDHGAIRDAVDAAMSDDPSGIVYLPSGQYQLDERLRLLTDADGVCVVGDGRDTVIAGSQFWWTDQGWGEWNESRRLMGATVANLRMTGGGFRSDLVPGRDNLLANLWFEDMNGKALKLSVSGTNVEDITVQDANGHGIGIDNGVLKMTQNEEFDDPQELAEQRDPNPIRLRRIHVDGAGYDNHGGRHNIDFGSGANIYMNKFISENSDGYGMKTPSVENARIYNGLIKDSYKTSYYINLDYNHNVYLDNVKIDTGGGPESDLPKATYLNAGDVNIGTLIIEGSDVIGLDIADNAEVKADKLISRENEDSGLRIWGGGTARLKNFKGSGNNGCDIENNGGTLVVEDIEGDVCGDVERSSVTSPEIPEIQR